MEKAFRYIVLGAVLGVSLTWLSSDLAVHAEGATQGEIGETRGVYHQQIEHQFETTATPTITLNNANGGVTVSSWDKAGVQIIAHKNARESRSLWRFIGHRGTSNAAEMAEALDAIDVVIESSPARVSIETVFPRDTSGNRWVDYELRVPRGASLTLHTANGRIDVSDTDGAMTLTSKNGAIHTARTHGALTATTSNGEVTCRAAEGPVNIESSNGTIHVDVAGVVIPAAGLSCKTSNGSIEAVLPARAAFGLRARSSNGRVTSDLPLLVPATGSTKELAMDIGGGGPTVLLETSNGSIRIAGL